MNLPQYRINGTYQFINTLSYREGPPRLQGRRGRPAASTSRASSCRPSADASSTRRCSAYVDDNAETATINKPLPGGQEIQFYDWTDFYMFVQDEWRVKDNLTLSLGLRYETPGNSIASLYPVNDDIVAAAGGDERYRFEPRPERDTDNWQPRVGFNWNPRTDGSGILGALTGGDKLVVRGGYARTNDYAFININLNIASASPFVAAINSPNLNNAFAVLPGLSFPGGNPNNLAGRSSRATSGRRPTDQFSFEVQREMSRDVVWRVGYVGTQGNDLFQTLDGNPRQPYSTVRVDPTIGRHPRAVQHGRVELSLAADQSRQAPLAGLQRRRALHVEQVHRHRVGDLQPVQR